MKTRYVVVFNKDLAQLKLRVFFSCVFWWIFLTIIITINDETIMTTHDQIVTQKFHLIIYTNENDINDEIDVSTIILFFSNDNNSLMMCQNDDSETIKKKKSIFSKT
jgi:hypothetical protein